MKTSIVADSVEVHLVPISSTGPKWYLDVGPSLRPITMRVLWVLPFLKVPEGLSPIGRGSQA